MTVEASDVVRRAHAHRRIVAMMTRIVAVLVASSALAAITVTAFQLQDTSEPRARGLPVLAHYMPWFEGPYSLGAGRWGWHWTMDTQDPDQLRADGTRQIASHYSPTIGPYDSSDPTVLRYHLLLMKYAGIDGVLVDWYGVQGSNADLPMLQRNTQDLIVQARAVGLQYAVVYEDRFARTVGDVRASAVYARDNWFGKPGYLHLASTGRPYFGVFGPITVQDPAQWRSIVAAAGPLDLRTLWNDDGAGNAADGQFMWPYDVAAGGTWRARLQAYYALSAVAQRKVTAVGYPGFRDYYAEGAGRASLFTIPYDRGDTFRDTLAMAVDAGPQVDSVQLATWNDFGEGTMIEPTTERGFASLDAVQRFTGTVWSQQDLRTVLRWYREARRDGVDSPSVRAALQALIRGEPGAARTSLAD